MSKKNNTQKFIYIVLDEGEYDKCFNTYCEAEKYCKELDYEYDTDSWHIIQVPIKDLVLFL